MRTATHVLIRDDDDDDDDDDDGGFPEPQMVEWFALFIIFTNLELS